MTASPSQFGAAITILAAERVGAVLAGVAAFDPAGSLVIARYHERTTVDEIVRCVLASPAHALQQVRALRALLKYRFNE
jgi:hypothetical protein